MGWTSYYRAPGESDRDHLTRELCGDYLEIVDCTTIKGTFYAAVRYTQEKGMYPVGHTFGLVVLQRRQPRDSYGHNYYRKEIDETMGPNEAECPVRILDLLSPTDSEYAQEWREACRKNATRKASLPKVKKGDVVQFAHPLSFNNGMTADTFTFVERSTFRIMQPLREPGSLVRIPSWKSRTHTVLA
jgi:hypothetical protein